MILVIGGTGNVGRPLVHALLARKAGFRVLVREPDRAFDLPPGAAWSVGNLSEPDALARAMEEAHAVFLLSPAHPDLARLQRNAVDSARRAGVGRIVKSSALWASRTSESRLARMHGEVEEYIRGTGLRFTFLRPNFFAQNLLGDAPLVRREAALFAPLGDAAVSFVDARDVGEAAAAVLMEDGHDGNSYPLTGPEPLTYAELARMLSRTTGKLVRYVAADPTEYRGSVLAAGGPAWYADALGELFGLARHGEASLVTDWVERLIGRPARTVAAFLDENAGAFI
ncbi:MAG: SDR family oxidoreductase [Deltaproteobacteria bacterium]|nr:SDR family oxidoreductase [Deltaproteobacteria bacterium]